MIDKLINFSFAWGLLLCFAIKPSYSQIRGPQRKITRPSASLGPLPIVLPPPFRRSPPTRSLQAHATIPREQIAPPPRPPSTAGRAAGEEGPPEMAPAPADGGAESQRQADLLKQEGNALFRKERLSAAIDAYTGVSVALRSPLPPGRRLPRRISPPDSPVTLAFCIC